ncbi:SWIM zinc finger family protein [Thermococcus sp.]|uniref:SWIM zinc finger family protein n=1 Tax=Thermococcus sp. TaxID=35749 RepID=UPI00261935C6|nr:SWIM zinc finger family protein [Thermococcus sp.]
MDEQTRKKGERYYRSGKVLWVVKTGDRLYGKVLGTYPYYPAVNLKTGESSCTCPLGGDCKHVASILVAYERGTYFEGDNLSELNPEASAWSFLVHAPELALDVSIKELLFSLRSDESGSETARLFLRTLGLIEKSGRSEYLHVLEEVLDEFSTLFPDYLLTERLRKSFQSVNSALQRAR